MYMFVPATPTVTSGCTVRYTDGVFRKHLGSTQGEPPCTATTPRQKETVLARNTMHRNVANCGLSKTSKFSAFCLYYSISQNQNCTGNCIFKF